MSNLKNIVINTHKRHEREKVRNSKMHEVTNMKLHSTNQGSSKLLEDLRARRDALKTIIEEKLNTPRKDTP